MSIRRIFLIFAAALITCTGYSAFNNLDYSARTFGMGSASVAIFDDYSSIYACPAGLSALKTWQVGLSYSRLNLLTADIGESYIALAYPLKQYGTLGFGWYNMGDLVYSETIYTLAYSFSAMNSSVGVNIKFMTKAYTSNEWTTINSEYFTALSKSVLSFGFSISSQVLRDISIGFFIDDFNEPDIGISAEERLPVTLKGGLAYRMKDTVAGFEVVSRADVLKFQIGAESSGLKLGDFGMFSFRLGSGFGPNSYLNLTAGMGIRFNPGLAGLGMSFDYGFMFPFGFAGGNAGTHKASLTITEMYRDLMKNPQEEAK